MIAALIIVAQFASYIIALDRYGARCRKQGRAADLAQGYSDGWREGYAEALETMASHLLEHGIVISFEKAAQASPEKLN